MSTSHSTKRKLSLLQLAEELGNVSKACQLMGYHRDSFYEIKRAFQTGGVAALVEQRRGPRGPHPNRVSPEVEQAILDFCLAHPTRGSQFVANQLRLQGIEVGPSGVRGVWQRHDLLKRHQRLLRLEAHARDTTFVLSPAQIRLLEKHGSEVVPQHVESSAPGELLCQDTFYEAIGVQVRVVLTDNGREFCGKPDQHPFELLLAMENIEHRTTKVATPRTNGFVARMNRTLLDECFRVAGRQTWYITPSEIQRDLDVFLRYYNHERSHQGYRLKGRTPALALREALKLESLPPIVPEPEETASPDPDKLAA